MIHYTLSSVYYFYKNCLRNNPRLKEMSYWCKFSLLTNLIYNSLLFYIFSIKSQNSAGYITKTQCEIKKSSPSQNNIRYQDARLTH